MIKNIQYKKLGEICDFISGGTPSKSKNEYWKNGNIPWIKISDFKEKYIKCSDEKITKNGLENSSAKLLKKGTILYTIFASVGKVAILDIEATTNQAIVGVNLKENNLVDKDFLYYFLCSIENNIKKQARGVAQNNINISILKNVCIPILPISSQKNIVKTLKRLEDILENFKQKKILINFLNKSLFTTMFGDIKTNDKNWKIKKLKELVEIKSYIFNENLDTIWLLNLEDIEPNTGKLIRKKKIYFKNTPSSVISFDENYILYSKLRPYLNKVFLPDEKGFGTSELIPLFPKTSINKIFLAEYLRNDKIVDFLSQKVSGAKMPRVIMKEFQDLILILPPIELQNKFAERIEKIEKLSFEIEEAIKEAENLYNSLISKYFD